MGLDGIRGSLGGWEKPVGSARVFNAQKARDGGRVPLWVCPPVRKNEREERPARFTQNDGAGWRVNRRPRVALAVIGPTYVSRKGFASPAAGEHGQEHRQRVCATGAARARETVWGVGGVVVMRPLRGRVVLAADSTDGGTR